MADKNIGALPLASNLADDSLLVVEQQGTAMKMTGALLKDYAKQGVEIEFQGYLDEAKAAADRAAGAVSSVTGMTVSAKTLASGQTATVEKSMQGGKVNLAFGLPKGEQGVPGPEGQTGPRGPQGAPGTGLDILGHYDTEDALRSAVSAPAVGDAYGVGAEAPYDIYVFDGVTLDWKNYGQLGGGGGIVPENVVTSEGGASFAYGEGVGGAPHVITFTTEEEPPLTAEDVNYSGDQTVKEAIDGLKSSVSDGKSLIASAITDKGVDTAQDAAFSQMAENIGQIATGADTSDATANAWDILTPKTAYTASGKVSGRIPSLGAQTITPGTSSKSISSGQYLSGPQTIQGDTNLTSANIKKGVSIFGVQGAVESSFKATLTVKVEVGAQVTAKCGDKEISALSTTGTVVMELPSEGTWRVTAARGMTQYTTASITVASNFSAELVPANHVDYFITATPLSEARMDLAAASVGDYALFAGGGLKVLSSSSQGRSAVVDAYNTNLTHSTPTALSEARGYLAAATVGGYALFGGGYKIDTYPSAAVDAYNASLTRSTPTSLSEARCYTASAANGSYALIGGGYRYASDSYSVAVDAYNKNLTRSTPQISLIVGRRYLAAASAGDYVLFAGGIASSGVSAVVDAYNSTLTRSTPVVLALARFDLAGASSGGYALFAGGGRNSDGFNNSYAVDAYDISLVRTTPAPLSSARYQLAATSVGSYALFGGGVEYYTVDSVGYKDYVLSTTVDGYDFSLTKRTITDLNKARGSLAAAAVGDYALFGGGERARTKYTDGKVSSYVSDVVDVYHYV